MERNKIYIYGKHAVLEALQYAPHTVNKVFLMPDFRDTEMSDAIRKADVALGRLKGKGHIKGDGAKNHQGIFASISLHQLMLPYDAFIQNLKGTPDTSVVYLEGLTDPHNVGAIIRSAAALGVSAVLIPQKGQAPVTGAVIAVSAGMAFRIPLVSVDDAGTVLRDLKGKGFTVYGLSTDAEKSVSKPTYSAPSVFVVGNESRGLTKKARQLSDEMLSVPIHPRAESLNVAAAMAITLQNWSAKHPKALAE